MNAKKNDDTEGNIAHLNICGYKLPRKMVKRIKEGNWEVPLDCKGLNQLLIDKSPFPVEVSSLDHAVNDLTLYSVEMMVFESEHLKNWLHPKWDNERVMILGLEDDKVSPGNIIPNETILFADCGLGSDTAFGLDYRHNSSNPTVVFSYWGENPYTDNRWKKIADSFDEFESRVWDQKRQLISSNGERGLNLALFPNGPSTRPSTRFTRSGLAQGPGLFKPFRQRCALTVYS